MLLWNLVPYYMFIEKLLGTIIKRSIKKTLDVYCYQLNFTVKTVIGDCKKFLITGEEKCESTRMWHGNWLWSIETATDGRSSAVSTTTVRLQIRRQDVDQYVACCQCQPASMLNTAAALRLHSAKLNLEATLDRETQWHWQRLFQCQLWHWVISLATFHIHTYSSCQGHARVAPTWLFFIPH